MAITAETEMAAKNNAEFEMKFYCDLFSFKQA